MEVIEKKMRMTHKIVITDVRTGKSKSFSIKEEKKGLETIRDLLKKAIAKKR